MGYVDSLKNQQSTADNLNPYDTVNPLLKRGIEFVRLVEGPTIINQISIGDAFTVGDSVNGIIGTANGRNGTQITIGVGKLGTETLNYVTNPNNHHIENFRRPDKSTSGATTLQYSFEDTTLTTATWDNDTNFELLLNPGTTASSLTIAKNDITYKKATMIISGSTTGTLTLKLSADGGSNFEEVSDSTEHVFTNKDNNGIRWQIINPANGNTASVTEIVIDYL